MNLLEFEIHGVFSKWSFWNFLIFSGFSFDVLNWNSDYIWYFLIHLAMLLSNQCILSLMISCFPVQLLKLSGENISELSSEQAGMTESTTVIVMHLAWHLYQTSNLRKEFSNISSSICYFVAHFTQLFWFGENNGIVSIVIEFVLNSCSQYAPLWDEKRECFQQSVTNSYQPSMIINWKCKLQYSISENNMIIWLTS